MPLTSELQVGQLYKLCYHEKNRIVLVIEDNYANYLCWDFMAGNYRTLDSRSVVNPENVTEKAYIVEGDVRDRFTQKDVRSCYIDGVTYAVRA